MTFGHPYACGCRKCQPHLHGGLTSNETKRIQRAVRTGKDATSYRTPKKKSETKPSGSGNHRGGWHGAEHGYIGNKPVTFALGWGTREGEVLLADGHVSTSRPGPFWNGGHNHYGKGRGPNANVKDRGFYSGPGA